MMSDSSKQQKGLIFNIQRFSIQDGPGIRTTLFLKGCPLNCPWCGNPEGIGRKPEIMVGERKCIACKKCADACSAGAISFENGIRIIDWKLCTNCLECAKVCPSHAIQLSGEYKTMYEAFDIASKDRDFYNTSGGGVTISGGEPLLQWEFVRELLKKCKEAGFHTALDTTAFSPWESLKQVLQYTDLMLFDIKHADPEKHKEKTGVSNELILENLDKASKATTVRIWLRIPLIPGFNDSESNMQATAEIARRTRVEKLSLLPYHELGKDKYPGLGKRYRSNGADGALEPDSDLVKKCVEILKSHGLEVTVGR